MTTVLLCIAFALGVALERRRDGGSDALREENTRLRDRLGVAGDELAQRRAAAMAGHSSAGTPLQRRRIERNGTRW